VIPRCLDFLSCFDLVCVDVCVRCSGSGCFSGMVSCFVGSPSLGLCLLSWLGLLCFGWMFVLGCCMVFTFGWCWLCRSCLCFDFLDLVLSSEFV